MLSICASNVPKEFSFLFFSIELVLFDVVNVAVVVAYAVASVVADIEAVVVGLVTVSDGNVAVVGGIDCLSGDGSNDETLCSISSVNFWTLEVASSNIVVAIVVVVDDVERLASVVAVLRLTTFSFRGEEH